jgi:hypothetical protein
MRRHGREPMHDIGACKPEPGVGALASVRPEWWTATVRKSDDTAYSSLHRESSHSVPESSLGDTTRSRRSEARRSDLRKALSLHSANRPTLIGPPIGPG